MLRQMAGQGLILASPARRSILVNVNVGKDEGIGSILLLKQKLRHGKPWKKEANDVLSFVGGYIQVKQFFL